MNAAVRKSKASVTRIRPEADEALRAAMEARDMAATVTNRLDSFEQKLDRLVESLTDLVRVEERHKALASNFEDSEVERKDAGKRLQVIETALPSLLELRKWIIAGAIGILSLVGMSVWDAVFHTKPVEPLSKIVAPIVKSSTE